MALYIGYALLLGCYLMGGMGFNLLVWGRQRESRVVGVMLILVGLTIRFVLIAPALIWLLSR